MAGEVQREGSIESLPPPATGTPPGIPRKDTYGEVNADLLFEKNLGTAGTVTLEGAVYKYFGDFERFGYSYFVHASYLKRPLHGDGTGALPDGGPSGGFFRDGEPLPW